MTTLNEITVLIEDYLNKDVDIFNFRINFFNITNNELTEQYWLEQITTGLNLADSEILDIYIFIGELFGFIQSQPQLLGKLLKSPFHHKHEDIAQSLAHISDGTTVQSLYEAAELKFGYLDYDETFQFSRKCIKALSKINNEDAISKLKTLRNSENKVIARYAIKELRYKQIE